MAKYNTLLIERSYGTVIVFENLNPQEVGQLTHLLGKCIQVEDRYVGGDIGYKYTRMPQPVKVKLIDSDILINPAPPAEEPSEG